MISLIVDAGMEVVEFWIELAMSLDKE